eukprot:CAMPEP_0168170266 /NCGR_PEP_ID=MMETSP0139_2-20121125/4086_1 /TAXON_ID=44445 /ORGANISM="Pseudo-nitzschia australis, Strain 10249 10 AB" /LENGTH=148 /DNA_ID=CAMNT_0008087753 /DNA_START=60 /DNA_END=506 /DNA_ORIENTATION=-
MLRSHSPREQLDRLFAFDAVCSAVFGILALLAPHGLISKVSAGGYNHSVHETFRLYGCLRLACGWILWHVRAVDDGRFRKHICEALFVCYILQALAVVRAQFTDGHTLINWIAILLLSALGIAYGSHRFGKGGNSIKVYELPTGSNLQ